jgi:catechol 2,3-dioxygenase-like lactoylglutathione lyase family enzyme
MNQTSDKMTNMPPWPRELFAITLFEEDLPGAKDFYLKAFGLPLVFEDENSAVFKIGATLINLLKTSQVAELIEPARMASRENGSRFVMTIHVDDVDALCAELTTHGVKLLNGPIDRSWGIRTASFSDPGGHIWEIAR